MLLENLGLFLDVYWRPRRAFSGILDQGSILFGAALVVIVSGIMAAGLTVQSMIASAGILSKQAGRPPVVRRPTLLPTTPATPDAEAPPEEGGAETVPPSPYSLLALVSLTSSLGDVFGLALLYDPSELDAHYQLGRMAREEKRYEDAIRHFEQVVSRDDAHGSSEVWREIGSTYLESGSTDHARWALSKYVERRPHDPEGLLRYGEVLLAAGDPTGAAEQFRACVEAVDTMPAYRRGEVARWRRIARRKLAGKH